MLACFDVQYSGDDAVAACVLFGAWQDALPKREFAVQISSIADYVPGEFYRRELPCLLALIDRIHEPLNTIVIDGYVHLGANRKPGLGAKLFEALQGSIPVIGVAKTCYAGAVATEVLRGSSAKPLFVTAVGVEMDSAADYVRLMHGAHRIPTLLRRVDRFCRKGC